MNDLDRVVSIAERRGRADLSPVRLVIFAHVLAFASWAVLAGEAWRAWWRWAARATRC